MKLMTRCILAAFAATVIIPATAIAQDKPYAGERNRGYWLDSTGEIARNATGLCWHTNEWTPALAVEGCDGYNRPVAAAPAPVPVPRIVAASPPAPAIVATAPPAAIVVAQARPLPQRMSFSADALFAFDKSELNPEGRVMLDDLVRQLESTTYDSISTIGHTDRFGSHAYNQKLSERRAQAVKDYLVSRNVPASRINAEGKGEMEPITKAGDCNGAKSAGVVTCLQPDRRVDVDMTGTSIVTGSR